MKYGIEECIGTRLRRLSRVADGYMRACIAESGVTENQMSILFVLCKTGKIEQGKIGEILVLERSTVSRNIKLLEKKNLVEKTADYRPEVQLSTKGQELIETLIPLWGNAMDELMGILKEEGINNLEKLEKKLL